MFGIQMSPVFKWLVLGEWRGLVVSTEDCHSKGRRFETTPSPRRERTLSKLEWRNACCRACSPREKKGGHEGRNGYESFWKRKMDVRKDKMVRRRRKTWGSRIKSIKLSTPTMDHGERKKMIGVKIPTVMSCTYLDPTLFKIYFIFDRLRTIFFC